MLCGCTCVFTPATEDSRFTPAEEVGGTGAQDSVYMLLQLLLLLLLLLLPLPSPPSLPPRRQLSLPGAEYTALSRHSSTHATRMAHTLTVRASEAKHKRLHTKVSCKQMAAHSSALLRPHAVFLLAAPSNGRR